MADHIFKMLLTPQRIGHCQHFAEAAGTAVTLFGADGVQTATKNSHPSQKREGLWHPKTHPYVKGRPTPPKHEDILVRGDLAHTVWGKQGATFRLSDQGSYRIDNRDLNYPLAMTNSKEVHMFVRRFSIHLKPNSVAEFTEKEEKEVIPVIRKLKGFRDLIDFVSPSGTEAFVITLWDGAESATHTAVKPIPT